MEILKTNYKDDVLDTSKNTRRKYEMTTNSDGTISLEDVTEYTQVGDSFGSKDINETNGKINEVSKNAGEWIGAITIPTQSTSYILENAVITESSIIDVYYAENSKGTVQSAGVTYSQAAGILTLTFGAALDAAVEISNIKVVNV